MGQLALVWAPGQPNFPQWKQDFGLRVVVRVSSCEKEVVGSGSINLGTVFWRTGEIEMLGAISAVGNTGGMLMNDFAAGALTLLFLDWRFFRTT